MTQTVSATLTQAAQQFLGFITLPHNRNRNTLLSYTWALDRFHIFCTTAYADQPIADFPLAGLQDDVLMQFASWMQKTPSEEERQQGDPRPYADASQALALAGLRRLLRYLNAQHALPETFDLIRAEDNLQQVPRQNARRIIRQDDRLPLIIAYYDDIPLPPPDDTRATARQRLTILRNRAFIHTLFATAGRISEIIALIRADVLDGWADELIITGKGKHERQLYFSPEAQHAIAAYCRERGDDRHRSLFISHSRDKGRPITAVTGWRIVKRGAQACQIPNITPHTFRHWRASQLANDGVPIQVVQSILGHADITTTRRYVHDDPAVVKSQFQTHTPPLSDLLRKAQAKN